MNGKHFIGAKAQTADNVYTYPPVSKVILIVDDENVYEAGTDEGTVIEKECPYATQAIADNLLSMLQGYQYQSIEADAARISPLAELGDGITVNGIYTQLAYKNIRFSTGAVVDVAAPGSLEAEHEYQKEGLTSSNANWKLAQTYSRISKTTEEIRLEVASDIEEISTSFSVQIDSLTGRVNGLDGQFSELSLTLDGLTVTDETGTTKIKGSSIETETLYVDAAHITGTLSANQINMTGAISWADLDSNTQSTITGAQETADNAYSRADSAYSRANSAYSTANDVEDTVSAWSYGSTTYIDGSQIMTGTVTASTLRGGTVSILSSVGSESGYMTVTSASSSNYAIQLYSNAALRLGAESGDVWIENPSSYLQLQNSTQHCIIGSAHLRPTGNGDWYCGAASYRWAAVYAATGTIQTSDRNYKTDIDYDMSRYEIFFDSLKPASCKYIDGTSGRRHIVMVSQDVEQELIDSGLTSMDFAGFVKSPMTDDNGEEIDGQYRYFLRYDEFIGLLIWQVQELKKRVTQLEAIA